MIVKTLKNKTIKALCSGSMLLTLSGCQTVSDAAANAILYGVIVPTGIVYVSVEKVMTPTVVTPLRKWSAKREVEGMEASGIIPQIDKTNDRSGIDKDQNGIRDDVDHLIEAKSDVPEHALVLKQIARGFQEIQVASEANVDLYLSYTKKTKSGLDCLNYHEYIKDGESAKSTLYLIDVLTANTENRKKWKAKVDKFKPSDDKKYRSCDIEEFKDYVFRGKRLADQK